MEAVNHSEFFDRAKSEGDVQTARRRGHQEGVGRGREEEGERVERGRKK